MKHVKLYEYHIDEHQEIILLLRDVIDNLEDLQYTFVDDIEHFDETDETNFVISEYKEFLKKVNNFVKNANEEYYTLGKNVDES